ncbi:MAG: 4Fe-4S ferredoxin [Desulfobacteraceae bacterium]|nr:MAG: 4Fe-4S ferredoxin [Desulfobacteraceae bacterium]
MKKIRKIIEIDNELCDGCGQCVPSCAEGALQIIDGKARIVSDNLCDGLGACMGECPNGAMTIIERTADDFDEEAVEKHLAAVSSKTPPEPAMACGCPSQQIQSFSTPCACSNNHGVTSSQSIGLAAGKPSALSHWPVKIRLIPAHAPFLKNADLLILADCAAAAYPALHSELMAGKVVMMGCPKFDNSEEYIQRFTEIFTKAGIKSLTIVSMEVPCCAGLAWIVKKGLAAAGVDIPAVELVIGAQGNIVSKTNAATGK